MPELPEVETIRRTLEPRLLGKRISGGKVLHPRLVQGGTPEAFLQAITGHSIEALDRRGKYLLFRLSGGLMLGLHLRMTGQLTVEAAERPPGKAVYLQIKLENGTELRLCDQRKFGRVFLFPKGEEPPSLAKLGPEPLDVKFTPQALHDRLSRRTLAVKKALLNQEIVAGIGNIYADEVLFAAGIHPARPSASLSDAEIKRLHSTIRAILTEAIAQRGTTQRNYCDGDGKPGSYQFSLKVYGRKGEPCATCGAPLVKMNFGGRGTHFCPLCQE
jgi:formamidopyrimidine-DNA glycosylase